MSSQLGIAKFWCKVEGKEPPKEDYFEYSYSDYLSYRMKHHLRQVLEGDYEHLSWAFTWDNTPQGYSYWLERCEGHNTCTREDIKYMEWLLYEFE